MKTKKCAFTGHRPQSLPFGFNEADERCIALKQKLRDEIIRQIEENGVTHFITGMAIGVDMFAAEIVLGLKSAYNGITLECAFPCETQAEKWSEALRDRYFDIASKCDKETLLRGGDADKKLDRLREKTQLMSVLKRAQTAQRQLNTFVVIPVDISVEFLNKIIQGNARP